MRPSTLSIQAGQPQIHAGERERVMDEARRQPDPGAGRNEHLVIDDVKESPEESGRWTAGNQH